MSEQDAQRAWLAYRDDYMRSRHLSRRRAGSQMRRREFIAGYLAAPQARPRPAPGATRDGTRAKRGEAVSEMVRGKTDAETCRLNGWKVGTLVRGHEQWERGGVWTTWRITAIGEDTVLVRSVEREYTGDATGRPRYERGMEHSGTFRYRDWREVTPTQKATSERNEAGL